jgi:hypothetical protein
MRDHRSNPLRWGSDDRSRSAELMHNRWILYQQPRYEPAYRFGRVDLGRRSVDVRAKGNHACRPLDQDPGLAGSYRFAL